MIWLASYPRSGNSWLRMILFYRFGVKSSTIYPSDAKAISECFQGSARYVKTHRAHDDPEHVHARSIYVVRDGLDVMASMVDYYHERYLAERLIRGDHLFGSWSEHVEGWLSAPDTLVIRYEELGDSVPAIAEFIGKHPIDGELPSWREKHEQDARMFRSGKARNYRETLSEDDVALFHKLHGRTWDKLNSTSALATR